MTTEFIGPKGKATVPDRKNAHGEWVVRFRTPDGKRRPAADYFTTDRDDALGTAAAMVGGPAKTA